MKSIAFCLWAAAFAAIAFSSHAHAQARGRGPQTASPDTGDFTEGNLKFHRVGGFIQVTDTAKNQSAGTIILPPGGAPVFAAFPGYDLKSAYEKHMNGGASGTPPTGSAASAAKEESPNTGAPQVQSSVPAAGFDAVTKTATLSDGRIVTFFDDENLKVQMPGTVGTQIYDLHYHGTSGGQFAQVLARGQLGHTGMGSGMKGPLAGGVTITAESANGMPGGKLYDTLEGGNLASTASLAPRIKPIIDAVHEAVDLAKPTGPKLAETKVVKTLLNNNLVR